VVHSELSCSDSTIDKMPGLKLAAQASRRRCDSTPDVVVFDPAKIQDHSIYEKPQQYATGMIHVFVNGKQVLRDGQHTGAKPGRVADGPGRAK
jgi:N-acyl-D-aspartate/D-glutamate deacylase